MLCEGGSRAYVVCVECDMKLCSDCIRCHEKFPTNKDHTTVKLRTLADSSQVPCTLHSDWAAELFCSAHQQPICRLCARTAHNDCGGLKGADRETLEKREELKQRASRLLEVKVKLEKQVEESRRLCTAMRQAANDTFDNLQNLLDRRHRQVRKDIAQHEQSVMASAEKLQQSSDAVASSMVVVESAKEAITRPALVGLMDSLDALEQQIGATKSLRANLRFFTNRSSVTQQRLQDEVVSLEFYVENVHGEYKEVSLDIARAEMGQDDSPAEATFRFTVDNISKLTDAVAVLSPPCMVRNLPWQIKVMKQVIESKNNSNYLGFFLQCNTVVSDKSQSWSCPVRAELRILTACSEPLTRKFEHVFYSKERDWGFSQFMPWTELLDPGLGYVKDDKVTLEVHVRAEVPQLHQGVWFPHTSQSIPPLPLPTLSARDGQANEVNQVEAKVSLQSAISSRTQSGKSEEKRQIPRKESKSKKTNILKIRSQCFKDGDG